MMHRDYLAEVLAALVTGYQAREGMKERFRSLSEYEIARRLGVTAYSYVEFDASPERTEVRGALDALLQQGLVSFVRSSGRYDAFEPTPSGMASVSLEPTAGGSSASVPLPPPPELEPATGEEERLLPYAGLERRLDEIIRLLRSIERKLEDR
ncbi:MAG: hypothetical protein HY690_16660 [Chloroflexi bacterium]|nr:hypothetical protein [Chloroflexota bacterium]